MFEHDYRAKFDEIAPNRALVEDTRERMRAALSGGKARPRRLTRRGLVAAAAAAALTVTALAAGPTIWQAIQNDLGSRAPYATEVEAACEDQGIRMEAVSALADNRMLRVYFTVQDLKGDRLSGETHLDYTLERTMLSQWNFSVATVEQLSYDQASRTALFVVTVAGDESLPQISTISLDIGRVLSGGRYAASELMRDPSSSSYVVDGVFGESGAAYLWSDGDDQFGETYNDAGLWPTSETLPSAQTEDGVTVLLPQPEREENIDPDEPFPIVAAGIAADGKLHVRIRNQAGALWNDLGVATSFPQGEESEVGELFTAVHVGNDTDFCLQDCGPEELARLEHIRIFGFYSSRSAPVDGNWSLDFSLQTTAVRTIPVSLTLPTQSEGVTAEGTALELSPLSLTLLCDQEPIGDDTAPERISFTQLTPWVTLRDGTRQAAALANTGLWCATWTFDQPIDPDQVVSITLNGQTIPLDQG